MTNYWINDKARNEIITKTQIPNAGNFELFAANYNLMDKQGLSFPLNFQNDLAIEKLYNTNNFHYFVMVNNGFNELYILPTEKLNEYTNRVVSKIDSCKNKSDFLNLLIEEMD